MVLVYLFFVFKFKYSANLIWSNYQNKKLFIYLAFINKIKTEGRRPKKALISQ